MSLMQMSFLLARHYGRKSVLLSVRRLRWRRWLASRNRDGFRLRRVRRLLCLPAAAEGLVDGNEMDADQSATFGQRVLLLHEHSFGVQERLIVDRALFVLLCGNFNGSCSGIGASGERRHPILLAEEGNNAVFDFLVGSQHRIAVGEHGLLESCVLCRTLFLMRP